VGVGLTQITPTQVTLPGITPPPEEVLQ